MAEGSLPLPRERVLICAPFGRDAALIQRELLRAGVSAEICRSIGDLASSMSHEAEAALVADEALRPADIQAMATQLAQQPPWSDFPVIVMTSGGGATEASRYRLRLLEPLGNISLLERPLRSATLISSVKAALRARRHQYQLRSYLQEREAREEALQRANRDLEQFAYSASHDLQEPLRMVSIYSQLLSSRYKDQLDADAQSFLAHMETGAKRMTTLIRDLLEYTQIVQSPEEQPPTLDANSVLHQALSNLKQSIDENQAQITSQPLPTLAIGQVHLLQLFQNLIGNALKYRGPNTPHISISSYQSGGSPVVCVSDNGIGIDSQYHSKVFGLFKRLHHAGQYEGTGIGLALCQRIVERYGGRIWVESAGLGHGATFCFTLTYKQHGHNQSA